MARRWRCRPESVPGLLERVRGAGAQVEGDESGGKLKIITPLGSLEGTYGFDGEHFVVRLTEKPAMLPVALIWSRLDAILGPPVMTA